MDTLPAELLHQICGLLDREDLNSIRVVTKTWAHFAALYLFQEITITPSSLERLRLIAQHQVIATCVRCIIFRADLIPSTLPEMWHHDSIRKCRTWIMGEEHLYYQRYVRAYCEQQRLRENNYTLSREIINLSIPMLRRLQRLRLAIGGGTRHALAIDNSSHLNQQWDEVLYDVKAYARNRHEKSRRDAEILKQFTNLVNALALPGVHIQNLSITGISAGLWRRALQLPPPPYCAGLTTLKTLVLESSVLFRHKHYGADGCCDAKALAIRLEEAQSLQTLELYGEDGDASGYSSDFLQCFRPSLPKLSKLCLLGVTTTEQDLMDALLAYRTTLARLDLTRVSLADRNPEQLKGSWHQFFCRVPESLCFLLEIRLRSLRYTVPPLFWPAIQGPWIQHTFERPYLKAVEHAIMNGTDIPQPM